MDSKQIGIDALKAGRDLDGLVSTEVFCQCPHLETIKLSR